MGQITDRDEGRKRVLLIATPIIAARKLAQRDITKIRSSARYRFTCRSILPSSGDGSLRPPVALAQIPMASGHLGGAGAMVIEIWQVKEQWYYLVPPEILPERQLIPIDKIGHKEIACGPLKGSSSPSNGQLGQ